MHRTAATTPTPPEGCAAVFAVLARICRGMARSCHFGFGPIGEQSKTPRAHRRMESVMPEVDYTLHGKPVKISAARALDAEALRSMLGDIVNKPGIVGGHVVEVVSDSGSAPFEIVTYPQCVDGHVVIHTGHKDFTTSMSVEDGSLTTTMPCTVPADPTRHTTTDTVVEVVDGEFLASTPSDLADRVDLAGSLFAVIRTGASLAASDSPSLPIETTWDTASCENGHVVMHYGHEDPNTMTSVYDGPVVTSVPCSK